MGSESFCRKNLVNKCVKMVNKCVCVQLSMSSYVYVEPGGLLFMFVLKFVHHCSK